MRHCVYAAAFGVLMLTGCAADTPKDPSAVYLETVVGTGSPGMAVRYVDGKRLDFFRSNRIQAKAGPAILVIEFYSYAPGTTYRWFYEMPLKFEPGYIYAPQTDTRESFSPSEGTEHPEEMCIYRVPIGTAGIRYSPIGLFLSLPESEEQVACGHLIDTKAYLESHKD